MRRIITIVVCAVVLVASASCRTSRSAGHTDPASGLAAQVVALSNEVTRLNERLDVMEKEWVEIKPSMHFIQKTMDELRYEPVVQEELRAAP